MARYQTVTLAGCVAMLAIALLLPLVNLMSYRFTMADLPHKIGRMVKGDVSQILGYVFLVGLLLSPIIVALYTWSRGRAPKTVILLPLLFAAVLTVLLLIASKPSPGMGLWLYLVVAVAVVAWQIQERKAF